MRRTRDVQSVRRRDVLRLTVVTAGGLALTGCTKGATPPPAEASSTNLPTERDYDEQSRKEDVEDLRVDTVPFFAGSGGGVQ